MSTLKSPPPTRESKPPAEETVTVIDTSKMSAGQRAALELTEAAREAAAEKASFVAGLFMGRFDAEQLFPYPEQSREDREKGDAFLKRLERFLREHVDPDEIDRTGEVPQDVIDELGRMGAFGIKIATEYGGLGLSQTNYSRAAMLLASYDANLTALLSAHQSIGVPQPLIMFGTEEQKQRFLPRVAKGEISAFALTELGVGSDPATMTTRAELTPDGKEFVINGEKLWCTNGVKAGVIVVMAKTPPRMVNGKSKNQITAFIVDMNTPGVEVTHRCHFMGLRALYNGVVKFNNVRVPRENIIWGEGKGLRVALSTLNTGRLTLPAACVGAAKRCLRIVKKWCNGRVQWGASIGKHAAIADKVAQIAANTFAMEAMTLYAASLVDKDKKADIRLEAAMCKMWGTEMAWKIVDETMQIRGGRGYETADSLKARGEEPVPVERFMRDCRINTIFEGSSEIMRLFIAREMLDPHLKISGAVLNSQLPMSIRLQAALKAGLFYAGWYPRQWLPFGTRVSGSLPGTLKRHVNYAGKTSRRLARHLFHAMVKFGPKLEREQVLLSRFVEIGADLFAMAATCARAQSSLKNATDEEKTEVLDLADYFCASARLRVERNFHGLSHNADRQAYRVAQQVLKNGPRTLEEGIVS
jgi:alkylation response protein AidB-like acyl-CoA dehydrogenase